MAKLKKNTPGHRIVRNALILALSLDDKLPLANIADEAEVCAATVKSVLKSRDCFKVDGKLVKRYAQWCFRQEYIESVLHCLEEDSG